MSWWRTFADRFLGSEDTDRDRRTWPSTDFYAVLGVPPDAEADEIKRATRLRLRQLVPDNPAAPPDAEEMYRATHEAFEVLRDPALRKEYDDIRRHVVHNGGAPAPVAAESERTANEHEDR